MTDWNFRWDIIWRDRSFNSIPWLWFDVRSLVENLQKALSTDLASPICAPLPFGVKTYRLRQHTRYEFLNRNLFAQCKLLYGLENGVWNLNSKLCHRLPLIIARNSRGVTTDIPWAVNSPKCRTL